MTPKTPGLRPPNPKGLDPQTPQGGLKEVIKKELVRKMYLRVKASILKSLRHLMKNVSDNLDFKSPLGDLGVDN